MVALDLRAATTKGSDALLRLALKLDAVATGAVGALSLAASPILDEDVLGIPATALGAIGLFLIAYAAVVWAIGSRQEISRLAAWAVVVANVDWVILSVVTLAAGWFDLSGLGAALVIAQAVAVLLFADLQLLGLRRGGKSANVTG